jgi:hypothetical protein
MSMSAIEFVENWVSENITPDAPPPADIGAAARALASRCLADAIAAGVPQSEMEDAFDDLPAFMAGEIEEENTREAAGEAADDE